MQRKKTLLVVFSSIKLTSADLCVRLCLEGFNAFHPVVKVSPVIPYLSELIHKSEV